MDRCWKNHAAVEKPTDEARTRAAAVEARAAAARCDAAREEAAAKTREAQEAAVQCVAARDNAAAAQRVARKAHADRTRGRRQTFVAEREANAGHDSARSAAAAAAFAALEASVRCAAACRHAVAAASAARQAVDLHVAAGGKAGAQDVLAAQEAANLCIAVHGVASTEEGRAAAAGLAVPRAYAAAAEARQAAASCDEALSDPAVDDDKKFLDSMRGWLMTVAALLVNMTFMAIMRPPSWVPMDFGFHILFHMNSTSSAPSPAGSHASLEVMPNTIAFIYLLSNTVTFAAAITLVVALVKMERGASAKALKVIRYMTRFLALGAAGSFASGTSKDIRIIGIVFGIILVYVLAVLRAVFTGISFD